MPHFRCHSLQEVDDARIMLARAVEWVSRSFNMRWLLRLECVAMHGVLNDAAEPSLYRPLA